MGGLKKVPTEGGSGGKRGHSGMEHWAQTAEIKDAARIQRRIADRNESQCAIAEHEATTSQRRRAKRKSKSGPPQR
jgi:hypothetical protein